MGIFKKDTPIVSAPAMSSSLQRPRPITSSSISSESFNPQPAMSRPVMPSAAPTAPTTPVAAKPTPTTPVAAKPAPTTPVAAKPAPTISPAMSGTYSTASSAAPAQPARPLSPAMTPENLGNINDVKFSDVYITPDKKSYIWGTKTECGLKLVTFVDFPEFLQQIEETYDGSNSSYLLTFHGRNYRVERTVASDGAQYCARKMPTVVPSLRELGMQPGLYNHLISIAGSCGLILLAGATGSGKSTTCAALIQEYLRRKGGYCFTIEDPIELPLDGVYTTPNNELGLCKQTTPPNGSWAEGIKSALRSKPKYIYLGEIRSPDVASEALRAATSGHLVLSTIHANNVTDAINALVKYAASSGISEDMAYELVANGFLGCLHQVLSGAPKRAFVTSLFANPDVNAGCQIRSMFRSGKLNIATVLEQQKTKIDKNQPLF